MHFWQVENSDLIALDALARRINDFSTKPKSDRSSSVSDRRFMALLSPTAAGSG
ncbi:hypothetical protein [Paraburkholderia sp. RL17-337-BIB-A]|uniref:hypothetical protein n=1 Tax=Paraburkholderia sp. RL17-337-BIB-A TaxID=3031636 RepID=UPI0038B9B32F